MKKYLFFCLSILILIFYSINLYAQSKIATVDINEIMSLMPENKRITQEIEQLTKSLNSRISAKETQFQNEIKKFNQLYMQLSQQARISKEKELNSLENQLGKLQTETNKQINEKQKALLQPVINKVKNAVKSVAQAKKYSQVLNHNEENLGNVIYATPTNNITNLVKARLNLK